MPGRGTDKVGRAGEHYVAAELNRRGAYASPFSGNVPGIDIVATDDDMKRMAYIQVKTKRGHSKLAHGPKARMGENYPFWMPRQRRLSENLHSLSGGTYSWKTRPFLGFRHAEKRRWATVLRSHG